MECSIFFQFSLCVLSTRHCLILTHIRINFLHFSLDFNGPSSGMDKEVYLISESRYAYEVQLYYPTDIW